MGEFRLTITVNSDRQHPPIVFRVAIPGNLAVLLMSTPITSVSLAVESKPGIVADKTKLLDFH